MYLPNKVQGYIPPENTESQTRDCIFPVRQSCSHHTIPLSQAACLPCPNPVPFWQLAREVGYKAEEPGSEWKDFAPVPCHRVVNSNGKMGANFGMGGPESQEKMLKAEGVKIKNGKVVFI